ncbi:intradiol ring-cleavage dioxygenase [Phenylobacterium aquaticum]|uniref:intradiol ring-cleavage dioxygenase n=1 Tax=Phenylobacterium aquaticum TaxID=1763816 RepID=UPI001F5CCCD0|nr:intradiol ring-cleavage dioxygenase [Phenylobacterium aquaticum]MCI3131097.1 intradiol ring-cleavage dioxygenase [Phenylobacterium aquaticum]
MTDHAHDHIDDHDRGLQHDLQVMAAQMQRRRLLGWLATGGSAALLAACGGGGSSSSTTSSTASTTSTTTTTTTTTTTSSGSCVADPTETNGPYPSDGSNTVNGVVSNILTQSGVVRSDIRSSFGSSTTTAPGILVTLTLTLVNTNNGCAPLSGYAIYLWHCNRSGEYSLYSSAIQNENYLRGVQVTDSSGKVTFVTIFPACYDGRWPHMHFEVYPSLATATSYANRALVSQLAMPTDICNTVFATTGYSASVTNFAKVSLSTDGIFGDNTSAQIAAMTPSFSGSTSAGYTATATIGLAV